MNSFLYPDAIERRLLVGIYKPTIEFFKLLKFWPVVILDQEAVTIIAQVFTPLYPKETKEIGLNLDFIVIALSGEHQKVSTESEGPFYPVRILNTVLVRLLRELKVAKVKTIAGQQVKYLNRGIDDIRRSMSALIRYVDEEYAPLAAYVERSIG